MADQPAHGGRGGQVTQLLEAAGGGDARASEELLPLVYEELRRLARANMKRESPGQTLQATALVHEAYVRLVGGAEVRWQGRAHFFGAAARAMRRILVDRARRRGAVKHGGRRERVDLAEEVAVVGPEADEPGTDLIELDGALQRLERDDPRKAEVVMLRYFAGLSIEETAAAMAISPATVKNEWAFARAWLKRELERAEGRGS